MVSPPLSLLGFCDLVEAIRFSFAWKSNVVMVKLLGNVAPLPRL